MFQIISLFVSQVTLELWEAGGGDGYAIIGQGITYPAHRMAEAHMGQLSALVYRDN